MEWNIQSRAQACQSCHHLFRDREPMHTVLSDERHEYVRLDVCEKCWTGQYSQGANHRRGFVSHWQGVYTVPPAAPPEPIQRETAETLLRRLVGLGDPQHGGACFILAVMLERKRLLKFKAQSREEGRRRLVYEQPKTGDLFTLVDPELRLDQLEAVQRDVAHLLAHGVDAPVAESPPTEPAPSSGPATAAEVPGDDAPPAGGPLASASEPRAAPAEASAAVDAAAGAEAPSPAPTDLSPPRSECRD
jgi:hypothetical protein